MRRSLFLSLTAAAVLATSAAAQGNSCAAKGAKLPAAGGWAEYQTDSGTMRIAYLGHESLGERMELSMTRAAGRRGRGGPMVMQMVVPSYPYEMAEVKEVVMQMGEDPPMKMSEQMLGMMRSRMPNASQMSSASCARMTLVGRESITVPAGTFQTTHYRDAEHNADVWVTPSIPFGMVKAVAEGHTVQLAASGTGATTNLTGTPQEMPGMMGPPGGRRPN